MSGPFVIGLTGSIGMGKSTASAMFRDLGVPVWDADAAVHRAYAPGGAAVDAIRVLCPDAVKDNGVDRARLSAWIAEDPGHLARIEAIVHPIVRRDRAAFLDGCDGDIAVLDIPLLFETGGAAECDLVAVVSAPAATQRDRVMARPGMTRAHFERILAKQMPDAEKRSHADVVIPSDGMDRMRAAIGDMVDGIRKGHHARNRS